MTAKKNASRYTIKFNPDIPSHKEAMRTLDEAGRSKAALIADAIRMRNVLYNRNADELAASLSTVSPQLLSVQAQPARMDEVPSLPPKPNAQNTSCAVKSDDDFWDGMNDTLKMFSV